MNKKVHTIEIELDDYYDMKDEQMKVKKNDVHLKLYGYYISKCKWGSSNGSKEVLESLVKTNIDWTTINKLYRFPHLSLSRDKLTTLKDKYNVKVVRDMNAADVCVISDRTIEKLTTSNYYGNIFTKEKFIKKFNDPKFEDCFTENAFNYILSYFDKLEDDEYIYVNDRFQDWNSSDAFQKSALTYFTQGKFIGDHAAQGMNYIDVENWENYKQIFGDTSTKVFVEDVYVNEVCSEDSIIIDWECYENIKKMISATTEDQAVAMTLMANCKINESKTTLGLLFYHHGEQLKGTKTWNQVAFKTLRKQFDHYMISGWNSSHTSTFSSLIEKLIKDDALTEESISHICDLVFDKVLKGGCGYNEEDDTCVFEMKRVDVRLKPLYQKKMKEEDKSLSTVLTEVNTFNDLPF